METENKKIVVLYHADCSDGFGGAFAAYKKFGDTALYLPVEYKMPPPQGLEAKEIYIIDFSYPKEILKTIADKALSLTIIDHHISAKDDVKSIPGHVYDLDHSGAVLAWNYFHSQKPAPKLLLYVEDGDLWRYSLPHSQDLQNVFQLQGFDFEVWERLANDFENKETFDAYVKKGGNFSEYRQKIIKELAELSQEVEFEGYKVLAVNAPRMFRSDLGHNLAVLKPPLAIVWHYKNRYINFSLRSNGSVDVSEIAKRYGGGGHKDAAGFKLNAKIPFPFR